MIIVKLKGGLGNQMFQYALGRHIALKNNTILKLDTTEFQKKDPNIIQREYSLDVFGVKSIIASDKEVNFFERFKVKKSKKNFLHNLFVANPRIYIREKRNFDFDPRILEVGDKVMLDGYWQSYKYFQDITKVIRKDFTFTNILSTTKKFREKIENSNSVCINVRRGDFVNHHQTRQSHGFYDVDYFDKAVEIINQKIPNPRFFIFSDDIDWCKHNLLNRYKQPTEVVEYNLAGEKFSNYLYLISSCKHQIIPNSSFGWWGAWLNQNSNKIVIAPKKFITKREDTGDLIPKTWIQI